MKLRTEMQIPESDHKIDHRQKVYFTGSCFSENIAEKFKYFGFDVLSNSHGIIYNPVSIETSFLDLANDTPFELKDLNEYNGKYFSFAHHGIFDHVNPQQVLSNINETIFLHRDHIRKCSFVFVTLGSAWVYTELSQNLIVANCHKLPASHFEKRLLTIDEIMESLETIIERTKAMNPEAMIVFTISPVKHLKDGFEENQLSKSLLTTCVHKFVNGEDITYFPSYEIMNDDLRDYRFWKEDMMHPNDLAIEYIWEKFSEVYFGETTRSLMREVKQFRQYEAHRPLSSNQDEIDEFEAKKKSRRTELINKYPYLTL